MAVKKKSRLTRSIVIKLPIIILIRNIKKFLIDVKMFPELALQINSYVKWGWKPAPARGLALQVGLVGFI